MNAWRNKIKLKPVCKVPAGILRNGYKGRHEAVSWLFGVKGEGFLELKEMFLGVKGVKEVKGVKDKCLVGMGWDKWELWDK